MGLNVSHPVIDFLSKVVILPLCHVGLSLAAVIQTIRTVVQESSGHQISLSFRKSFDPSTTRVMKTDYEKYSAESDIGINSRKETERKLTSSPYYSWHFMDIVSIPSAAAINSTGHEIDAAECIMAGDIGYDTTCKLVIVGTVTREINGGDLKLFQLCMSNNKDEKSSVSEGFNITLLKCHRIHTVCLDVTPTLQLWRDDTAASSTSASSSASPSASASVVVSHSSLFASVISYPATVGASQVQGSCETGSHNLDTSCVVTTVFMPYSCGDNSITQNSSNFELCVESNIAVMTSSLSRLLATPAPNASSRPLNATSALNTTLFNAKFGLHTDISKRDGTDDKAGLSEEGSWKCPHFRFQLLVSPVLTVGAFCLREIFVINEDAMSCVL